MKEVHIISRKDGSQVKIVAELFNGPSLVLSFGNYVLHRRSSETAWVLCKNPTTVRPIVVTSGEILKVNMALLNRFQRCKN